MKKLVNHLLYCLFALTVAFQGIAEAAQIYVDFSHSHETEQNAAQTDSAKKSVQSDTSSHEVVECGVHLCSMCHLLSTNMGNVLYSARTPIIFDYQFSENSHIAEGLKRPPRISLA